MDKKKKVFVLVPDGTGIKNYLYTNLFKDKLFNLGIFHNFDAETLKTIQGEIAFDYELEIPKYKESIREKFLRELIHRARLRHNARLVNNETILEFWTKKPKSLKLKAFYASVIVTSWFINSYRSILKLEKKYQQVLSKNPFYDTCIKILQEVNPDLLFCTHQRAEKAATIFKAAATLGIQTTTVIYSWDNIPKARLALRADNYLVWSQYMKDELLNFYPEFDPNKVLVSGTPQFEFYYDPSNRIPKKEFYATYGLDPQKKIICFSGDDTRTSPYDPLYLDEMVQAIQESTLKDKVHVLFRKCPVDVSGRYDWVLKKYPNILIEAPPLWNFNAKRWTAVYPTYADVSLLVSTAFYCDVVVNVGSTMAFDFGMFHKPCIYINYDTQQDPNWSVDTIYKFQHFRSMPSKEAVYWFNKREEIASVLIQALQNPNTNIAEWFATVVNYPEDSSNRIKEILLS